MRKLVFSFIAAWLLISNTLLYLVMVIYGNLTIRILSFIPCAMLCGVTIALIFTRLLKKDKEKNDDKN